ncbi:helix-turn-helix domain-containing protein [Methylopila sp. M107]|uniref:helix-turn-helix domain-containing protein n=1 Tax=Methylopila sp. M107 TaxID=1101190 RepID=UPI00036F938F|nr:helix-turn-helix domain-containing protein [Methylopila sp. M107]
MDHASRLEIVEAENDELRERVVQLEELLGFRTLTPIEWGLTPKQASVLGFLLNRPMATKDELMTALYALDVDDPPHQKIIDVFVCHLRRKLRPFGIEIRTVWGQGYAIDRPQRDELKAQLGAAA